MLFLNLDLRFELTKTSGINVVVQKIVILVKRKVLRVKPVVRRSMASFESCIFLGLLLSFLHLVAEVGTGKDSVMGNTMILPCGLVVVSMTEVGSVGHAKDKRHIGISIINTVQLFSTQILFHVMLNNWALVKSSMLSSSGIDIGAISESKDILKSLVLKSVSVHIYKAIAVGKSTINKFLMRFARGIN